MIVKNDYNNCLTNVACSIRKYFGLAYHHRTLPEVDKILEERKPKNVVMILFDGMGSRILERVLPPDSFFLSHKVKTMTSVFPATTVAATTSVMTGLNPVESGMLGWNMYYKGIDKTITTFLNVEKGDKAKTVLSEAVEYKKRYMKTKTIMEEINEKGEDKAYFLSPYSKDTYDDLEEMLQRIQTLCQQDGRKFIYAYDEEPDHTMHIEGADAKQVKDFIRYRNIMVERLANQLEDTAIIVLADHGHLTIEPMFLRNYPAIIECLERTPSIEPRATAFFVKEDKKEKFETLFQEAFSDSYDLYTKEEVISNKLFGDGEENSIFRDALGDYLAIAKTRKILYADDDNFLVSQHAGYTEDEIEVPLIIIET